MEFLVASLKKDQIVGWGDKHDIFGSLPVKLPMKKKIRKFVLLKNLRLEFRGDQTALFRQIWIQLLNKSLD